MSEDVAAALGRLIDAAKLLAAYLEGVLKMGGGSKGAVRNMLDNLGEAMVQAEVQLRKIEKDQANGTNNEAHKPLDPRSPRNGRGSGDERGAGS